MVVSQNPKFDVVVIGGGQSALNPPLLVLMNGIDYDAVYIYSCWVRAALLIGRYWSPSVISDIEISPEVCWVRCYFQ